MTDAADDKLDEVQRKIDEARDVAQRDGILVDPDEPRFYESGSDPEADDQTIAPPG